MGLKKVNVFAMLILLFLSSALALLPQATVEAQEGETGNIHFTPNVIPQTSVSFKDSRFVFDWEGNHFEVAMFVEVENVEYEVEVEAGSFKVKVKIVGVEYEFEAESQVVNEKYKDNIAWGLLVSDIPSLLTNFTDAFIFKIENATFGELDVSEFVYPQPEGYNVTDLVLPNSLYLSYKDLFQYNFTVSHPSRFEAKVEGVKGKPTWNLDPIVYSSGVIIDENENTEATADDCDDFYVADKNGNLTLYSGNVGMSLTLSQQIQPADELALKINFTLSGSNAGQGDTIDITGTDKDGDSLFESLVTEADGEYTTTNWFRTITDIDCVGFSSGNLLVEQSRWGVVWKWKDAYDKYSFRFLATWQIGNGTSNTWFVETLKQILFPRELDTYVVRLILVKANAHLRFGKVEDASSKTSSSGCQLYSLTLATSFIEADGDVNIYSSHFISKTFTIYLMLKQISGGRIWNTNLERVTLQGSIASQNLDIYRVNLVKCGIEYVGGEINDLLITSIETVNHGLYFYSNYGASTFKNVKMRDTDGYTAKLFYCDDARYLVNPDFDVWKFNYAGAINYAEIYRQYEFGLTVTFQNGTAVNGMATGARVVIQHYGENAGVDYNATLGAFGYIPTQTLTKGFYNQTGGDTPYSYEPYNLHVYNVTGYAEYSKNFTIQKTAWEIALTPIGEAEYVWDFVTPLAFITPFALTFIVVGFLIKREREKQK